MKITSLKTRWVLDSLGNPTVEVDVYLKNGAFGRASAPNGLSVGSGEAADAKDQYSTFAGRGVSRVLNIIEHVIAPTLLNHSADNQESIDAKLISLEHSKDRQLIGSGASLAVSMAVASAAAQAAKQPLYMYLAALVANKDFTLPRPIFSLLGGGLHAQKTFDLESIMVTPLKAKDIHTATRIGVETSLAMRQVLYNRNFAIVKASDGSYTPVAAKSNKLALGLAAQAVLGAGYKLGEDAALGIDFAASHYFNRGHYELKCESKQLGKKAYYEWLVQLIKNQHINYIEDPFDQEAWEQWTKFNENYGKNLLIAGDDLIATNVKRLQLAAKQKAANSVLIKPNQVGTLTETLQACVYAKKLGFKTIVAARAGDTNDSYLAHLAVGLGCDYLKSGAPAGGERIAKYNELLRISESLHSDQLKH